MVAVQAVSVNPIDTKLRQRPFEEPGYRVLGFDAAGVVEAVGAEVKTSPPATGSGMPARYSARAATPSTSAWMKGWWQKPNTLGMQEAAALPLTALTAWEALEDQLGFQPGKCEGKICW